MSETDATPAPEATSDERPRTEAPFLWQAKRALQKIKNDPLCTTPSTTLLIYVALTWIASDEESPTFCASLNHIGGKVGLTGRIVPRHIQHLERACVVRVVHGERIDGKKVNDMNRYTLLKMAAHKKPKAGNVVPTGQGNQCTTDVPTPQGTGGATSDSRNLNNSSRRERSRRKKETHDAACTADAPRASAADGRSAGHPQEKKPPAPTHTTPRDTW